MSATPFLIFPWQRPFLPDLKSVLHTLSRGNTHTALLIVPNKRPLRYFSQLYPDRKSLPQMITITELAAFWRGQTGGNRPRMVNELDCAALLHRCVQRLAEDDAALASRFTRDNLSDFLPWGIRLAALLEEFFTQRVDVADIAHVEAEVNPTAAALLSAIGRIREIYMKELVEREWTTPGLDYASACQQRAVPPLFQPSPDRTVLVAGFFMLTRTQDCLLRRIWQAGAHVCLHSDPALATTQQEHWACAEHGYWIRRWNAQVSEAVPRDAEDLARKPRISFFAGYDCHSQLLTMRETLGNCRYADSTAIVLTDSDLLMPTLHHLPDKNINVSMGYPLERSPLCRLLEILFAMQAKRMDDGRYYWRNLLQCLRHPYLNMLRLDAGNGRPVFLREALGRLRQALSTGSRFVDLDAVTEEYRAKTADPSGALLSDTLKIITRDLACVRTTAQMAQWLHTVCDFLIRNGGDMWRRFPLDAEALYRLMHNVIPVLRESSLTDDFQAETLHEITRQLLRRERIPFEAEPLTGLQVLGMLETRLLYFDRVLIMDATDDKLPGNPPQDPLLPDSLRRILGLSDAHSREAASAHTLYRLCAGAKETHFFWQEGIRRSAFSDGKKTRSRFVEQLIWEEEKQRKKLLVAGEFPLATDSCPVRVMRSKPKSLSRAGGLDAALQALLRAPLSATLLDVYLRCPLRFAWQFLCNLVPRKEINESDDPAAVGTCIHETLHALYAPHIGKEVRRADISAKTLRACFFEAINKAELHKTLPADSYLMLETAAPLRLDLFLANQPERTKILCLEEKLSAALSLAGHEYLFRGIVDRLDMRDGCLHVLDYKTGTIKKHDPTLWTDRNFFAEIADSFSVAPDRAETIKPLFEALRERLPSLQLPCYLAMLMRCDFGRPGNAAFVNLRDDGAEVPLFGELDDHERVAALDYCDLTLALALTHMRVATKFEACPDKHCVYCPYAGLCDA
ncbi:MAG: PD-(D/E)XK nuclease family protein [Desulfovibrio sp.]|nr:PD-(D/E)XK nuclease family protein [Desulfovibrio sp.]